MPEEAPVTQTVLPEKFIAHVLHQKTQSPWGAQLRANPGTISRIRSARGGGFQKMDPGRSAPG
ncbi:MAG TPA: hypothetical protein DDZ68_05560 [Parvularcula sp.]|nr:hypothetical protein [Parvularcula sp.]